MDQRQGGGRGYRGQAPMRGRRFKNRTKWDNRGVHFQEQGPQSHDGGQSGPGRGQFRGKNVRTRLGPGLKITAGQGNKRFVEASKAAGFRGDGQDWFRVVVCKQDIKPPRSSSHIFFNFFPDPFWSKI